ncbi:hypothetical protein EDD86DRAFT_195465 [Gorgonomyces haynaldii]|nr:hypothetical protein EDD86DRAFT_195465 [Gorgonomyces haynaldii]
MQIRHLKSIVPAGDSPNRVVALAWSPNNMKLAVVTADRVIQLFDDTGDRKDKFATKPADSKNPRPYQVCGVAFSPDGSKLAVAQTDAVVFVYKIGLDWGEKKSICNKFIQTCDITSLCWPVQQPNAVVFGCQDGKVRVGNLKTNKAATLYQTESPVVSCVTNREGTAILSGHLDGSLFRFYFDDGVSGASQGKFAHHSSPPVTIGWGESVLVVGPDKNICFYNHEGGLGQNFDYSKNDDIPDFGVCDVSPSGGCIILGSFDRLHVFNYVPSKLQWEEAPTKYIENLYTVSSLAWKPDGSRLVVGNMTNAVELYDCCLRRSRYKGKFEFNYVSPSQVIVKRLSTGSRIVLKSHYGYEIQKVNIFQDQYLIAHTPETLLMGDLATCKLSEIPWIGSGSEKFYFENPQVCMVFNVGELSLVEYGVNEILGSCRTEHMNPHLISVRLNERKSDADIKRVAYLVDLQTIHVLDLTTQMVVGKISHDTKIDWLELSGKANKLLFRDKKRQLHLLDVDLQKRTTLLNYCSYVQWVPGSDVVVAQSRENLCIWYAIDAPERVTLFPIKGEIEDIERGNGKTEVIVDEGVNTVSYTLDEGLIEFGAAVEDKDYDRAITLLESLEMTPETEAMWKSLSETAIKDKKLPIAERCYAALGDMSRTRYLHQIIDTVEQEGKSEIEQFQGYLVQAKLAVLDKQFKFAESIFLDNGKVEEAMEMYQEMHKWDQCIKVAEMKNHPDLDHLKQNYYQWLIETGQEEEAGKWKEEERDYVSAVNLYLKGGLAAQAFRCLQTSGLQNNFEIMERVAQALLQAGIHESAGQLYEQLGNNDKALETYKKGKCFRQAVDLCRAIYPEQVVKLEEQWGDHLSSLKQMDGAINHYIEAGKMLKAIDAAINSKQWKKAVSILDSISPPDLARPYFIPLAKHFSVTKDYQQAERYFVAAGRPQDAVDMYTKANKWDKAHTLATSYMSKEDVNILYISQAKELESKGKLKEAENLYLTIQEPDLAINMYKNHRQYDNMIRLVTAHHKDLVLETHLFLGKTLESEANFRQAEHHYLEAKDWKSVINMYCANNMYEEGYRVAKSHGGQQASKQVAYLWARSLGGESAVKLLTKFGLLDAALEFATENGAFDFAFELSRFADKYKIEEIHYKHAMFLEDEGKYKEAQDAFILAGKPREAILMFIHNEDWDKALQVAEKYEPGSVVDVLIGQAKILFSKNEFSKAEGLLLRAQRPEVAIKMYKESRNWKEAIRFAKQYLPAKVGEVHKEYDEYLAGEADSGKDHILMTARQFEQQHDYPRAIDMYLKLNISHSNDLDFLQEKWERAVDLAFKFLPDQAHHVVSAACHLLLQLNRFAAAGDLYLAAEMHKDAIDAYISGQLWDHARKVVTQAPKYKDFVENQYVNHLKTGGHVDALMTVDSSAGLEVYAQKGDWDKCLEMASLDSNRDTLCKYLGEYCTHMIRDKKFEQCVQMVVKYAAPSDTSLFEQYKVLCREICKKPNPSAVQAMRDMLYNVMSSPSNTTQQKLLEHFGVYAQIAHLMHVRNQCAKKKDLVVFAAKLSVALLRYTKTIPADVAFMEAGQYCKNAGMNNMAFVCWNRFLDLCEAMEEGDTSMLENIDFQDTDVPFDLMLSNQPVDLQKREEIRDWVLQISLDQKVNQELDKRPCEDCGTNIYAAQLFCPKTHTKWEPCVVSGYPVLKASVSCSNCGKTANRDDWNKYMMIERTCPWCKSNQAPVYF